MENIYMDYGATTPVRPEVTVAMQPYLTSCYGNPSAQYDLAVQAKNAVEQARSVIAASLGVKPGEIYFTSGGTESDNWALKASADRKPERGHIITSMVEHHAILRTCQYLEAKGCEVTYLPVNEEGCISVEQLEQAIQPNTILISIMYANNEIGSIQPIRKIGEVARKHGIPFHTDAVQAYMHVPIRVQEEGITMLSASAHKFGGPKGTGFLYLSEKLPLGSLLQGGGQERGRRAGTENVAGIIGMGEAVRCADRELRQEQERLCRLRDQMIRTFLRDIPYVRLNGAARDRLPGNVNMSFQFVEGPSLLVLLNEEGICASAGSACSSGDGTVSHVLQAIGLPEELSRAAIRFSFGKETTEEDIVKVVEVVKKNVQRLRNLR